MKDEIIELMLNNVTADHAFADSHELYEHLNYSGGIDEIIDSNIDIYNYDLRKWAVENYHYIEQAMEDGFAEGVTDFHQLIQLGQCGMLGDQAAQFIEEIFTGAMASKEVAA